MSARFFLYRRNGTYYFRWAIPQSLQRQMGHRTPSEVRISLQTTNYQVARRHAAEYWLAGLDAHAALVAKNSPISYKQLLCTMNRSGPMPAIPAPPVDDEELLTLAEVTGTADLGRLKDTLALLRAAGAEFRVAVGPSGISIFRTSYDEDGEPYSELVETMDHFVDMAARLTERGITEALASDKNLFQVREVQSDQVGMWEGSKSKKRYYDAVLPEPFACNVSSIKVAKRWTSEIKRASYPSTEAHNASDCVPIKLSKGRDLWAHENSKGGGGSWTQSTLTSYLATVNQFIDIVTDKLTTTLTPDDFKSYEVLMGKLPKDWARVRSSTSMTLSQIALRGGKNVSSKTLKDKGACLRLFFQYLQAAGYWHGKYGYSLFKSRKKTDTTADRIVFTEEQLREIFAGKGLPIFKKAKHGLYVWGSILLLYTAARPGEIGQLKRQDILQDSQGTWHLKLQESDGDEDASGGLSQHLKNKSSIRSVPIHPQVIEMGFLKFIDRFKPAAWLFPKARRPDNKWGAEIGKFWNEKLLVAAGLKAPGVVLYCLRHTGINKLKHDATLSYLACAYTGHTTKDDNTNANPIFKSTYGKVFEPTLLAEKLHPLLNFHIDWAPLTAILKKNGWS